ncbi:MAG: RecB family exonuclease, partial [Paracoccaceae bacterium]
RFAHLSRAIGPDAPALRDALLDATAQALAEDVPSAALRRLWIKRMERAADWFASAEARRRAHAPLIIAETRGARVLKAPAGPFTLTARADRIDLRGDGTFAVYDYKTGAPPGPKEQKAFAKQLTLTGAVARAGGFEDVAAGDPVEIAYLGLTGAKGGGVERPVISDPETLDEAWANLIALIAAYDRAETPYAARLRPRHIKYAGDYDHLARHGEWGDAGAEEDDA